MPTSDNRTYDEIEIGETLSLSRKLTRIEVEALALLSGDSDPFHLDRRDGAPADGNGPSTKSVGGEALLSTLLCRRLPAPARRSWNRT